MLDHNSQLTVSTFPIPTSTIDARYATPLDLSSPRCHASSASVAEGTEASHHEAISYILVDCFISLGQGVKDEKTIDQSAIVWLHDRYRTKFLHTMRRFGNTWLRDRLRVKGVSRMLGERAVFHAAGKPTIDLASIMQASTDVEKYCRLHAARRFRSTDATGGTAPIRHAGYWCESFPPPPPE